MQWLSPACHPRVVERARAFALVAEEYDRGRPGYPSAAIAWLLGSQPLDVADLGAGTGKLTAALVAEGHRVVAVEPLAEMRAVLRARVPQARVVAGVAEQTGLAAATVDAVVAGSAFHWFDRSRALPEIERILRAPGILGMLGNGFDTSPPWVARLRQMLGGSRLGRPGHWPDQEELLERFLAVEEREFPHQERLDRDRLLDLALSRSRIASLAADERRALLEQIAELWDQEPGLRGNDSVALRYMTRVRRCRGLRRAGDPQRAGR
jgi:SAM-dependent methyltransferase